MMTNQTKQPNTCVYDVVVGNVGTVHTGPDMRAAVLCYNTYVDRSKTGHGRCANESVYLMEDGNPIMEHQGSADDEVGGVL